MIKRYYMIQFIESPDPDAISIMHQMDEGNWVKYDDYEKERAMYREGLEALKASKNGSMESLNNYVTNLLEVTR